MFLTPTLRNSATRHVFFHNGVYHSLEKVLDFYNFRDTKSELIYPADAARQAQRFNDLPKRYSANVDTSDAPFNRQPGQSPVMKTADMDDIIAFLRTLNDGFSR